MDFSKKIDLRAFTLADPYRVVIDLPQVTFNLPPKTGETGRGLVQAFAWPRHARTTRVVMDVSKAVRIDKAFDRASGRATGAARDRLAATDRDSFMKTLAAEGRRCRLRRPAGWARERPHKGDPRRSSCSIRATAASTTAPSPAAAPWKRTSCWSFPPRYATSSNGPAKYRVVMTRTDDTFVPLVDRVWMTSGEGDAG